VASDQFYALTRPKQTTSARPRSWVCFVRATPRAILRNPFRICRDKVQGNVTWVLGASC
jgi:ribosomal protein S14